LERRKPTSARSEGNSLKRNSPFIDIVDEGLGVLGETSRNVIYELLESDYSMQKSAIPGRFAEFSKVLRDSMGSAIDPMLEFIVQGFFIKLQVEPPKGVDLTESIQVVDRLLQDSSTSEIPLNLNRRIRVD
jgi:hypothetical protein